MRDTAGGEKEVIGAGVAYLPQPSGFKAQADGGTALYDAYQKRAQFPEIVLPTIHGMVGVIHRTEAQIELPDAMQPLWEKATKDGLPLEALHRRITAELLTTGRYALLADAATEGSDLPWLAGYTAEALINWADDRSMFVLDESGLRREGFRWEPEQRFRVLEMKDGTYTVQTYTGSERAPGDEVTPSGRGNAKLNEIPFVVIGARDLSLPPELPPLLGDARSAISLYQLSADYRWQLFITGQETLVVINGDPPSAVGAGAVIAIKQGDNAGAPDVKYVGPAGTGIAAHRTAILDERQNAAQSGARLFNSSESKSVESGDALRIRFAAETATLTSIALASAQGLEKALRHIAIMIGQSPDAVTVKPNLSFVDATLSPGTVGLSPRQIVSTSLAISRTGMSAPSAWLGGSMQFNAPSNGHLSHNNRTCSMQLKTILLTAAFAATIPAANWLIGNVGTECLPNGPCLIPVGFGLLAPSGVLLVGAALVLRDFVHEAGGAKAALAAIGLGGVVAWLFAPPALILASVLAFVLAELADFAVYAPLRTKRLWLAVLLSGVVGAAVDSAVFLWVAFGSLEFIAGQIVGKLWMTLIAAVVLAIGRRRSAA